MTHRQTSLRPSQGGKFHAPVGTKQTEDRVYRPEAPETEVRSKGPAAGASMFAPAIVTPRKAVPHKAAVAPASVSVDAVAVGYTEWRAYEDCAYADLVPGDQFVWLNFDSKPVDEIWRVVSQRIDRNGWLYNIPSSGDVDCPTNPLMAGVRKLLTYRDLKPGDKFKWADGTLEGNADEADFERTLQDDKDEGQHRYSLPGKTELRSWSIAQTPVARKTVVCGR